MTELYYDTSFHGKELLCSKVYWVFLLDVTEHIVLKWKDKEGKNQKMFKRGAV